MKIKATIVRKSDGHSVSASFPESLTPQIGWTIEYFTRPNELKAKHGVIKSFMTRHDEVGKFRDLRLEIE